MNGFIDALSNINLEYVIALLAGTVSGYVVGALPGFSATMGVALFVPFSYKMNPYVAFAFLIALYCSAVFSGSIPAILIRTPGTPASLATIYDGYPMAQKGQAGRALGLATLGSVFGGIFSAIVLIFVAGGVAKAALMFGPQEYFALAVLGLSMVIGMSGDDMIKGLISMALGLMTTIVGMEVLSGYPRYTFGQSQLMAGIQELPVLIGVFAITEVLVGLNAKPRPKVPQQKVGSIFTALPDLKKNWKLLLSSSVIGTFLGTLPGVGGTTAAIMGYNEAKRLSKEPEKMGTGQPEGILGPETANNAVTGGALIPMLALGIPGDPVTAILLGALMIQGLRPGPELFSKSPEVVMSIYISVILAYIAILIFSTFSIKYIAKLLKVRSNILSAFVLIFCVIGTYALQNSYFDVFIAIGFGIFGYILRKFNISFGPFVLALVMGGIIEEKLGLSLQLSGGSFATFFTRPISLAFLVVTAIFMGLSAYRLIKKKRSTK